MFIGLSLKAWKGTQIDEKRYDHLNRIVNQHCIAYYCNFWKDRNENLRNEATQRKRVIEWQQQEHSKDTKGQHPQIRKHAIENEVDATN